MRTLLRASHLAVGYSNQQTTTRLLQDFNFSLVENEIVAVIGASGVGKSSLVRILAGLEKPLSGEISYLGKRLEGPHPHISVAFQDPTLLPWRTLEQNVMFGLNFRHQPTLTSAERSERVRHAIESVGLNGHISKYPAQLSGGMSQRVALARCLARLPKVMLLDEPFSALDEVTRHNMQRLLLAVLKQHRMSALLITHDIDEALMIADRIILLGGNPGQLAGEWYPHIAHPRDNELDKLATMRMDILKKLRNLRPDTEVEERYVHDV